MAEARARLRQLDLVVAVSFELEEAMRRNCLDELVEARKEGVDVRVRRKLLKEAADAIDALLMKELMLCVRINACADMLETVCHRMFCSSPHSIHDHLAGQEYHACISVRSSSPSR